MKKMGIKKKTDRKLFQKLGSRFFLKLHSTGRCLVQFLVTIFSCVWGEGYLDLIVASFYVSEVWLANFYFIYLIGI